MSVPAPYIVLMSQAIRTELERHGRTLKEIPDDVLLDYIRILGAFHGDLQAELEKR